MTDNGRGAGPDFIEALARGLDVLRSFRPGHPSMTLSDIPTITSPPRPPAPPPPPTPRPAPPTMPLSPITTTPGLARPTVRRILITRESRGYVRAEGRGHAL